MTNDRSDSALRERLGIAEKATQGPWYHTLAAIVGTKKSPEDNDATCICFTEWRCSGDPQANAAHIAASSPDVVREDIEEILRLRQEVKNRDEMLVRLEEEVAALRGDLDFASMEQHILTEKLFNSRICHKDILCEQEDTKNWKFEGQGGCKNCWDEWARHLASDVIEEAELNAE